MWAINLLVATCLSSSAIADEPPRGESTDPTKNDAPKAGPSTADEYYGRALAWAQKKEFRKAIADYTAAIRLEPKRAELFVGRGRAQAATGDLRRAFADLDLALRLDPKSDAAYSARAEAWKAKGDFARAKADYEDALRLQPKNVVVGCNFAWLLATCPDERLRDGRRAVKLATAGCEQMKWKEPELIDTLAAAYAETGNFDEARTREIRALKLAAETDRILQGAAERLELYKLGKPYREPLPKK